MSIEGLISIVIAIGGAAVTWGALLTRVRVLEARVKDGEEGRRAQGKRIGKLERWKAFLQGYGSTPEDGPQRRPSRAIPAMSDDDSGAADEG